MKKILVFTATYNEKDNIKEYLEKLLSQNIQFDILIVDDNSPDGTNYII
ncbi:MAG: glycosyltransferase, partial [Pelagibacteraceae bacterium]